MRLLVMLICLVTALPAKAEDLRVDLELILAVDVSRSMTGREMEIQRRGYAEALTSDDVVAALTGGPNGRVALTYVEWAGIDLQRTIVDWTVIASAADAERVARVLTVELSNNLRRTSISAALDHAAGLFVNNGYNGLRRVIDISGDGPNNMGRAVTAARDAAVDQGITINGLPLMTREGLGMMWHLDDLDLYYKACVIGGPGAFVIPVRSWAEFVPAVRQKLILELVGRQPEVQKAAFVGNGPDGYDCLIGEKIWDRIMGDWN